MVGTRVALLVGPAGFWRVAEVATSPAAFDAPRFQLTGRKVPPSFLESGEPNLPFFDDAAAMVEAVSGGRTMVLRVIDANMYSFANRLDDVALLYRRGQRLAPLVEAFRAKPHVMLVTPAAWASLDLPHLVDNVVILHLAILRPNALRQAVLEEALIRRGQAAEAAWGHLAAEGRGNALRRPSLAMGREIRAADDACGIRIADSAFRCVRTCCWNSAVA